MENNKKMDKNLIIKLVSGAVILVSLIIIVVVIFNNSITASEYNQIEYGMTYEEVVEIVGCEGEYESGASYGGSSAEMYFFRGVLYHVNGANAVIYFQDGEVVSMAQVGLIF